MKLNRILAIGVIASASLSVAAQNTYSGYFMDNNLYRHQINPAFGNEYNYVSFPALGNFNLATQGNLNLKDVIYNYDGRTTTFMNPNISAAEVMGNLSDDNKLGFGLNLNILTVGFKGFKGYNTIEINSKANFNTSIPRELFSFLKEGISNQDYDISDVRAQANAYVELALGHSRNIGSKLRVGAKVKVLFGGGNVDAHLEQANLNLNQDRWTAQTQAILHTSMKGLRYKTSLSETTGNLYVDDVDVDGAGLGGFGLGFDLGATYRLNQDWQFSAAVLDLGFISWSNDMVASTNGVHSFDSNDYVFNPNDDADNSFSNEFDNMKDKLATLYELSDMGDQGGRTTALATTINLGAEYTLPVYRKVKFGLLNSTRINGMFTATNFRLSANYVPVKWLGLCANVNTGTYGTGFGWMVNIAPKGFNLYFAMDQMLGKLAKQGVPLNSNAAFNFGINFPF